MRPRPRTALAASLALLAAGCGRCGSRAPAAVPPERYLPADAPAALLLPRLGEAASQAGGLLGTALAIPAAAGLAEPVAALKAQLGFDPLDPAGLASAGLAPERGAAAAALPGGGAVLALPVADAARLDATLARLARDRLGASVRDEARERTAVAVTFRAGPDRPAALCYAVAGDTALLAAGPAGPAAVAAALSLPEAGSLAASPAFAAARAALGDGHAALLFAPPSPRLAAELPPARDGGALGLRAGPAGLWLRAVLLLPPAREEVWREVAGGPEAAGAGREELSRLPGDLFAAARFGGSPQALLRRLGDVLPAGLAGRLERAHLDLARDLGAHLAPGAAAGLSLSPRFDAAALAGGVAAAARDPFRLVHLSAVARVKDPEALRRELLRLEKAGRALGVRIASRPRPGGGSWSAPVGGGTLAWALEGDRLLVAGGAGRLAALGAGGPGFSPPTPGAQAALESGGAAAAVDFPGLVRRVRALPPQAFGTGPDGFVLRALVDRFLEPASHLAAASLRLEVIPGAARIDLAVEALAP